MSKAIALLLMHKYNKIFMQIKAIIFDMDGLMLDTEPIAEMGWRRALADWGYHLSHELYLPVIGTTIVNARRVWVESFGADLPIEAIYKRHQEYINAHIDEHGIPIKPGLLDLLTWLEQRHFPKAVGSSTQRARVLHKLNFTGLQDYFNIIVGGDEVTHGKPAPDIFLAAAELLHISPHECVVLEDSEAGIRAAHAAGMISIMIPDLKTPSAEIKPLARQIFPSLMEAHAFFESNHFEIIL